ncbi:UDP-N-acetylmuramate dehydrogenase [Geomonas oryzae]|uniref:UDP-N-acetylmuramate dehydrogenase n=1 Tax=Geomonas oryzae TaxID=2364273 RepID=UPI00100C3201|nr:UDP-N-acetylmuramate dehydrogenase [Geomonas oryzae]
MPSQKTNRQDGVIIEEDVLLAPFTTFQIGGPARYFARARTVQQVRQALRFAQDQALPFCFLGGGSNLLVSDDGFEGLVVRLVMDAVSVDGATVSVEAGYDLNRLVLDSAQWGLSGLEPLAGIPGTVGGAVRGNAGAYGGVIGDVVTAVSVLDTATLDMITMAREECTFAYRDSLFKRDPWLAVMGATLTLSPAPPAEIKGRIEETIAKREAKQLSCDRSAGSFFMNPVVQDAELIRSFEADQGVRCRECRIPAGWLIERAGVRNLRVGGAAVSHRHANYLVNTGGATAADMMELAWLVKAGVRVKLGVALQEEVSTLGFTR